MLYKLGELNGESALDEAERVLQGAAQPVHDALHYLKQMAEQISIWLPQVPVHFDLAELRGYHFHTGIVFAAFVPSSGKEIARGGRYDDIGRVFGRARPATGFSTDLKTLMLIAQPQAEPHKTTVFAPSGSDPALQQRIDALRKAGRSVVSGLPGQQGGAREMGCAEQLSFNGVEWELTAV
jgi:ATP phosphoribosyltransferase regulatory subunit